MKIPSLDTYMNLYDYSRKMENQMLDHVVSTNWDHPDYQKLRDEMWEYKENRMWFRNRIIKNFSRHEN